MSCEEERIDGRFPEIITKECEKVETATKKKGTGYILNLAALILGIVGLVCYLISGTDQSKMTETVVSAMVYVPFALAILLNAAGLVKEDRMFRMFAMILYFLTLALWGFTQAGYIVNVLMGIDGNSFSLPYILSFVGMIVPMVLSFIAAVTRK